MLFVCSIPLVIFIDALYLCEYKLLSCVLPFQPSFRMSCISGMLITKSLCFCLSSNDLISPLFLKTNFLVIESLVDGFLTHQL